MTLLYDFHTTIPTLLTSNVWVFPNIWVWKAILPPQFSVLQYGLISDTIYLMCVCVCVCVCVRARARACELVSHVRLFAASWTVAH